ncbi:MAG: complex I NDUFA9 subunit family protein [Alphaproteobacteria bacterium]|nr:complex I NDUFA9 subunit family protein [Alphaproteobacteria bacterium]|tara:strand:+ start:231 stop:1157 length:927 start_codon:yes stop_codon:yes gene_type:complete
MNNLRNLKITIFGGTGFLGRHLIKYLCNHECIIQVPTRSPAKGYFLQPLGDVGQINLIKFDLSDNKKLKNLVENSDIIINLVGILYEKKRNDFIEVHYNFVKKLVDHIKIYKKKFVQVSALGVNKSKDSLYSKSKNQADIYIEKNLEKFLIIRPSLIFGPEDNFFNKFAQMSLISPFLPLIAGGTTKFQPVYVEDVSKGIVTILKKDIKNKIFEFGGPDIFSFKELLQILLESLNRKRLLIYIPKRGAVLLAKFFQLLPNPLLTEDQIKLLENDNIVLDTNYTFKYLDISPVSLKLIIPDYLKRFKKY